MLMLLLMLLLMRAAVYVPDIRPDLYHFFAARRSIYQHSAVSFFSLAPDS